MDLELRGRNCLVTGASAGIGAGIARVLAAEGARLAVTARRADRLATLADEIARGGGERPVVIAGDITTVDGVHRIADAAVAALGQVDILVNAAGGSRTLTLDSGDAGWDEAFALNFTSLRRLTEQLVPAMKARQWGRVINITGQMEPRTLNGAVAAKAAVHLWAKGLSCDLAPHGVTVNCVAPGRINSEQILEKLHPTPEARREFIARHIPIGYFGEPEDMGHMVAFLASPRARYITGSIIEVDGGMHNFGF
jgi:3-oxoacyl-[acyl-carrier protein] reductase